MFGWRPQGNAINNGDFDLDWFYMGSNLASLGKLAVYPLKLNVMAHRLKRFSLGFQNNIIIHFRKA